MNNILAHFRTSIWFRLLVMPCAWRKNRATLLLIYLIVLGYSTVSAQCPGATAPTVFSTWNWETTPYTANGDLTAAYCNTWHANIKTGAATVPKDMRAPWDIAVSPSINQIAHSRDYLKANGWQLVRFDFGGKGGVTVPYFMLYHRPTGVLRIYAYLASMEGLTGSVMTISHASTNQTSSQHSTATLSTTNTLLKAPDKYFTGSATDYAQEQMSYVCFVGSKENWTMGQFTLALDPKVDDPAYELNSYQVQIFGLVQSTVELNGSFEFQTTQAGKDFAYGGPAITPTASTVAGAASDAQDYAVKAQKFLGNLATVSEKIGDLNKKAAAFGKVPVTSSVGKGLQSVAKIVEASSTSGILKKVSEIAGGLGSLAPAFGIVGTVIGFFTDDAASKSAFVPTVSKGTITLNGTITTRRALHTFQLLTPSTPHYKRSSGTTTTPSELRSQLPYVDCPTGIFNIRNTPILESASFRQIITERTASSFPPGAGYPAGDIEVISYRLKNDVQPVVNVSSGLEIVSVNYAIAQKVPLSLFKQAYQERQTAFDLYRTYSYLYGRVATGEALIMPYDPGKASDGSDAQVIVQTPFASCYNGVFPFAALPEYGKPYLRVIAILHQIGTPVDSSPVYYAQDYEVDTTPTTETIPTLSFALNSPPFFYVKYGSSYPAPATPSPSARSPYATDLTKTGTLTYDDVTAGKSGEVVYGDLLFDANSSVSIGGGQGAAPVFLWATQSIGITGSFAAPSGVSLAITTDIQPLLASSQQCLTKPQYGQVNLPCTPNDYALRISASPEAPVSAEEMTTLSLAPNPASNSTLVQLDVAEGECIQQVVLMNVQGQVLWQKEYECTRKLKEAIPLSKLALGIYVVRVTSSAHTYSSKLSVQ